MVFSSLIFIFLFLPLIIFIYYISRKKLRNYILLFASLFFYAWAGVDYLKLLIISIILNYILGIFIDRSKGKSKVKAIFLCVGIILNLSILFYYKYYDFFIYNINDIFNTNFALKYIALPIGISFFTFQGISYIIDIYRNDGKVNKNIFSVALYISFFPQLVAGPIIKYKSIDNEIRSRKESIEGFSYGIDRFIVGLAKKVVLADILAAIVNDIMPYHVYGIDIPTAWLGAICYTFQIYFDFSGYSDMAIGLGYMFGFSFMENFNYPYISKSITEFWRRWHISLSTWFREYLYIPLGGNRKGNVYFNLFIVFLVTGVWHGAAWNFIIWGLWHGFFIIIERLIRDKELYKKIPICFKWMATIFIVIIGWVLFSASSFTEAIDYIKIMFGIVRYDNISFSISYFINKKLIFWLVISIIASTPIATIIKNKYKEYKYFEVIKSIAVLILFLVSIIFVVNSTYSPFIYFQF